MSLPRQVLPGECYMITRRCTQRQFLMRPDAETNNAFLYCLALSALRYGVKVLFAVAMSNHHHTGIYDPEGTYPLFLQYFHRLFAKCQNGLRGRRENFWSSEQTSVVRLLGVDDYLDKMAYALANPVQANLVDRAAEWPGFTSWHAHMTSTHVTAFRPKNFFREDGDMPISVSLTFERPPFLSEVSDVEYRTTITGLVRAREEAAAVDRNARNIRVLGCRGVLAQDWRSVPSSFEQPGGPNPRFAARTPKARQEALEREREFLRAYRDAWEQLQKGVRTVEFPAGTWALRVLTRASARSAA